MPLPMVTIAVIASTAPTTTNIITIISAMPRRGRDHNGRFGRIIVWGLGGNQGITTLPADAAPDVEGVQSCAATP